MKAAPFKRVDIRQDIIMVKQKWHQNITKFQSLILLIDQKVSQSIYDCTINVHLVPFCLNNAEISFGLHA